MSSVGMIKSFVKSPARFLLDHEPPRPVAMALVVIVGFITWLSWELGFRMQVPSDSAAFPGGAIAFAIIGVGAALYGFSLANYQLARSLEESERQRYSGPIDWNTFDTESSVLKDRYVGNVMSILARRRWANWVLALVSGLAFFSFLSALLYLLWPQELIMLQISFGYFLALALSVPLILAVVALMNAKDTSNDIAPYK
ncbi:MAG TPA: hypothetical protein VEY12_10110 [Thermoplasmata archaeon]|nr:hypothetical protein [Thermoplasmata archaeon]